MYIILYICSKAEKDRHVIYCYFSRISLFNICVDYFIILYIYIYTKESKGNHSQNVLK